MTSRTKVRKPAAFSLDDPHVLVAPGEGRRDAVVVTPEPDPELPVPVAPVPARRKRMPWAALFWTSFAGLTVLGLALAVVNLVEDLFARADWLGYAGLALAVLALVALLAITVREASALMRLGTIDALRNRAAEALVSDERAEGQAIVGELIALTRHTPGLARARANLQTHLGEIIDGRDLVHLAERELMTPLDAEARRLVSNAAKRVSIVTAVSPRAAVDMLFVFGTALALVRRLAVLYGARPGTLGLIRLIRHVVSHLAVTGGMAVTDGLIQQMIGHGVAAKLSARLGEGVLNGLLTARLGLAAIEVTRPLPFSQLRRPALNDLAGSLMRQAEAENTNA
jgi:putative membrane protein